MRAAPGGHDNRTPRPAPAAVPSGLVVQCPPMRIAAVVLAAGEGRRIGGPKALLRKDGVSFLARVALALSRPGVFRVLAVIGHEAARVRAEAGVPAGVGVVENERYRDGMLSSIL